MDQHPGIAIEGQPQRVWLIENPTAGQETWQEEVDRAAATFRAAAWEVAVHQTTAAGDATRLAREAVSAGATIVVVAGGDGTVNEALQGLGGQRETALAVLPGGTVNVWATELGAEEGDDLPAQLVAGRRLTIDLGTINDHYFLLMVSAGFDAEASALVSASGPLQRLKRVAGRAAYGLAALAMAGRFRGREVTLTLDGRTLAQRSVMLIVGNTRLYGGITEITHRARADDGLLDVCVLGGRGALDLARRAWTVVRRQHAADPEVLYRQARQVELRARRPLRLQADGEDIGTTPATIAVAPRALDIITYGDRVPAFLGGDTRPDDTVKPPD